MRCFTSYNTAVWLFFTVPISIVFSSYSCFGSKALINPLCSACPEWIKTETGSWNNGGFISLTTLREPHNEGLQQRSIPSLFSPYLREYESCVVYSHLRLTFCHNQDRNLDMQTMAESSIKELFCCHHLRRHQTQTGTDIESVCEVCDAKWHDFW